MLNFQQFLKKPIRKDVDEMDNCHYQTLYKRNWSEDNYTEPDFLSELELNTTLTFYSLEEAIGGTVRVSLSLSVCILYSIMYYHLANEHVTPVQVFQVSFSLAILGYVVLNVWRFWNEPWNMKTIKKVTLPSDCMVAAGCGTFSYLFVPILRTVTRTVDIDTVHAVCTLLFGVHLFSNNYGVVTFCVSKPLSMNSALFSMICLSSRLQSDYHCLALLSFGVLCFICYPQFSQIFWEWTPGAVAVIILVASASYTVSSWLALFIIIVIFMIVVVSPLLYMYWMQHKLNIKGPWDEATPDLSFNMDEINKSFVERRNRSPPTSPPSDSKEKERDIIVKSKDAELSTKKA